MTAPYHAHDWVENELITASRLNALEDALAAIGTATMPRALLIFYGVPQQINGKNDPAHSAQILASYDDVVLGAGLQSSSNPNHTSTVSIISTAKAMNPGLIVWGYLDLGVTTNNWSLTTIGSIVNDWAAAGAQGVFLDHAGTDYGVSRTRLNAALDSVHNLGLVALINATNQADLQTNAAALNITSADACLLESVLVNTDGSNPGGVDSMTNFKNQIDSARANRDATGLRILSSGKIAQTSSNIGTLRQLNESVALIGGLDGFGVGCALYSASGTDANVAPAATRYWLSHGYAKEATYSYNGSTELARADLGLTLHVESNNNFVTDAGYFPARGVDVTAQSAATGTSAATPNTVVRRDGSGAAALTGVSGLSDVSGKTSDVAANKGYVDTAVAPKVVVAGDLGGTPAAPTVTSGANHTHTSAQVSDAASAPTASKVVKRDANGRAQVADPAAAADIATKNYVDNARPVMYVQSTDPASSGTVANGSIWFQTS